MLYHAGKAWIDLGKVGWDKTYQGVCEATDDDRGLFRKIQGLFEFGAELGSDYLGMTFDAWV